MCNDGQEGVFILCFLSLTCQGGPPTLVFILIFIRGLAEEEGVGDVGAEIRPCGLLTASPS